MSAPKLEYGIGVKRAPGGWVAVRYKIVNGRLQSTELLHEPDLRAIALEYFMRATRQFWDDV